MNEIEVVCNEGTKYRIKFKKGLYLLQYRNDTKGVEAYDSSRIKIIRQWVDLYEDDLYSGCLDFLFDEIRQFEAKKGV